MSVPVVVIIHPLMSLALGMDDPAQLRDLADAAARNENTTLCLTGTDQIGRPVAHACGKPGPGDRTRRKKQREPDRGQPRLTPIDRGPPGSHGTWRYTHGDREIIFAFEPLTGPCDHRHQAAGHDPGRHLKHLTAVLHPACTHPACRVPQRQCDY